MVPEFKKRPLVRFRSDTYRDYSHLIHTAQLSVTQGGDHNPLSLPGRIPYGISTTVVYLVVNFEKPHWTRLKPHWQTPNGGQGASSYMMPRKVHFSKSATYNLTMNRPNSKQCLTKAKINHTSCIVQQHEHWTACAFNGNNPLHVRWQATHGQTDRTQTMSNSSSGMVHRTFARLQQQDIQLS